MASNIQEKQRVSQHGRAVCGMSTGKGILLSLDQRDDDVPCGSGHRRRDSAELSVTKPTAHTKLATIDTEISEPPIFGHGPGLQGCQSDPHPFQTPMYRACQDKTLALWQRLPQP